MSNYEWAIAHSSNGGSSWTTITDVCQTWTYRYGRRAVTDQWGSGAGSIEGFDPSSLPTINVGDWVRFSESSHGTQFILAVADFTWTYNPASTADTWTITLEDAYAQIGRIYFPDDVDVTVEADPSTVAWGLATTFGINLLYYGTGNSTVSDLSIAKGQSGGQVIQSLANQAGAYIQSHRVDQGVTWVAYDALLSSGDPDDLFTTILFSDVAGQVPYTQIQFEGLADSYFDLILVNPVGLTSQSAGTGTRAFQIETLHRTEAQALDRANYLLIELGSATQTPSIISTVSDAVEPVSYMPGNGAQITLRGSTYYATIEGGVITATPAQTRITLNLSDREATNYLILNDTVWGKLDENRLGF